VDFNLTGVIVFRNFNKINSLGGNFKLRNMKKAVLSLGSLVLCILTLAQAPEFFSYQVIVRDATNHPITNQNVSFQMSILKGSISVPAQYTELHSATTNGLGLITLAIGNGTGKTGDFTTIDWGADKYFLKVEIDPAGGTSYTEMGTTQLLSVPYALYSKTSKTATDAATKAYVDALLERIEYIESRAGLEEPVTDYDGNKYRTIRIGFQIWFDENLKVTHYNDGSSIPNELDNTAWAALTTPAYCWYNNDETTYKNTYGAYYNWYAASTVNLCPTGWHVPSDEDWHTLVLLLDANALLSNPESSLAGCRLKEIGTAHWNSPNEENSTNDTGFTALPGGTRGYNGDGVFQYIGYIGSWWSATENDATSALSRGMHWNNRFVYRYPQGKSRGYSVRCLKD
jgi:uncharacterized protein (TIGR02145 family)